jgi:hypothetical protein
MTYMFTNDVDQQALGFLIAQTTYIEPTVYRIKYPDLNYRELVPIDTSAPPWTKSITVMSVDMVGKADWFTHLARDMPLADITRGKYEVAIEMAGVGYRYTTEELQQAMMVPNTNLTVERAAAAKRAAEEFIHNTAMYGQPQKNWLGLINHTLPVVVNVGTTWAARVTANQTGNILADINGLLMNIWLTSQTVEMADTLLLPLGAMSILSMTQLPNTTMNLLDWVSKNNIVTQQTGRQVLIRAVRGLDTAGSGGQSRAIAYTRDPDIIKMHIPMPHQFLEVWRTGVMIYDIPGIFRLAPLEIRRPGAIRFLDGM